MVIELDRRSTCDSRVRRSSKITAIDCVGEPAQNTARPGDTRMPEMSVYEVSIRSSRPFVASTMPSRHVPFSQYVHRIRPSDSNAYVDIPKTHCGSPNSASMGQSAWTDSPAYRYRFHQPV